MGKRILVVDDEKSITDLVRLYLENEGFHVYTAENCAEAEVIISTTPPDLILLDIMLPDKNGIDFCTELRKDITTPILFLSCKEQEIDKIIALSVGGDDYITKPFLPGEMVARVKANLRRTSMSEIIEEGPVKDIIYRAPGITVNATVREVYVDGKKISMTAKEFDILQTLISNPKRIYSTDQLFERVWKEEILHSDRNTVMVYMSNLRKKIDNNENGYKYILNIRGVGYKFDHHLIEE